MPLFPPSSQTGDLLESTDWSKTPLGPVEHWPPALRIAAGICLNSRFPMFVWWGPELINLYNDAYIPVLGGRHPAAFGRPAKDSWRDVWPVVGPQAEAAMRRGEATWNERVLLVTERHGYTEDTWFTWSFSPIPDEHGAIGGVFCACTEDTPRVRVERERDRLLRDIDIERHRLMEVFRQSPAFLAVLRGPDHIFDFVNERYSQLIGGRHVVGATVRAALPEIAGQGFFEILDRVYATGEPYFGMATRLMLRRHTDCPLEEAYVDFVYQPVVTADGSVNGILVHGVDVTEQKHFEQGLRDAQAEAQRASRMKDEFLATLSHELRTPLNAILGWSQLLKLKAELPPDLMKGIDVIARNARAQGTIIDDLLDMSAIISGKVRLQPQSMDLAEVVRNAVETARPTAAAKQIRLEGRIDALAGALIHGDAARIQQVLWNLLTNAIKFTSAGGRVDVALEQAGTDFVLKVADTGEGIEPEFLPFIFDRFRQADASKTRRYTGLGLGLSIVRQLAELHGGTVKVESAGKGRGAVFTVALPRASATALAGAAANDTPAAAAMPSDGKNGKCGEIAGLRVLVVDDDRDARHLVKQLLENCDASVTTAASAREATALVERQHFDVLVSDIGMPEEDGHTLLRRIRSFDREHGGDIPAIALTAYARPEDRVHAVRAGFQMHLAKPVEPSELIAVVASVAKRL